MATRMRPRMRWTTELRSCTAQVLSFCTSCHVAMLCRAGHLVSGYVKQHLPIILVNHLTSDTEVKRALTSGFVEVDKSLGNSRIDCEFSGSTAVVSYLKVCCAPHMVHHHSHVMP